MVERAVGQGWLQGIRIPPSAPTISNMCFADDTILFSQATEQEAVVIRDILHRYAQVSGQIINMEKSTMLFSPNIRQETSSNIQQILPFQVVERFEKYFGLPIHIGRSKVEIFGYLKDRLWARVKGWNEKNLSKAGNEVLIKAVLQEISTYVMSCFKLPTSILDEVEKIIRRFGGVLSSHGGFPGWPGLSCVGLRRMEGWVSEMWQVLTFLYWRSNRGEYFYIRSCYSLVF